MKNYKTLSDQELQNVLGQGVLYWVGRGVARVCESFTHIYG
ncbi:bacteriocin [Enterococcus gilvus]|nr:bacteriocin [Enterococcus gilvus]